MHLTCCFFGISNPEVDEAVASPSQDSIHDALKSWACGVLKLARAIVFALDPNRQRANHRRISLVRMKELDSDSEDG